MTIFSNPLRRDESEKSGVLQRPPRKCQCISDSFSLGVGKSHSYHSRHGQPVLLVKGTRRRAGSRSASREHSRSNGGYRLSAPALALGAVDRLCLSITGKNLAPPRLPLRSRKLPRRSSLAAVEPAPEPGLDPRLWGTFQRIALAVAQPRCAFLCRLLELSHDHH